jgi:hypothetical protein
MHQPFPHQALGQSEPMHQVDGDLLEHAGPDPPLDIGTVAPFDDDRIDAVAA